MTVPAAKRIAYTTTRAVAAGVLTYLVLWTAVTAVELLVLEGWGKKAESPLPPPGDPWLRAPSLLLVLVGGLWVALRSWREHLSALPRLSLVFLLAVGGGGLVVDQVRQTDYLQCTSADAAGTRKEQRWECSRNGDVPAGGLAVDSDNLVSAGDQACAWLEDRPWGEPPDAGGIAAETLAVYYAQDLEASGSVLTSEEALSARVALPAWYRLCPFQQKVHHGDNLD
jgi:hypothetical protein